MRWCRVMSVFSKKTLARLENCARVVNVSEAGPMSLLLGKKRMSTYRVVIHPYLGERTQKSQFVDIAFTRVLRWLLLHSIQDRKEKQDRYVRIQYI